MEQTLLPITEVKTLFIIDGYRIWADTYEAALEHYNIIVNL